MKLVRKLAAVFTVVLVLASVVSLSAMAEITPHDSPELPENTYSEETGTAGEDGENYTEDVYTPDEYNQGGYTEPEITPLPTQSPAPNPTQTPTEKPMMIIGGAAEQTPAPSQAAEYVVFGKIEVQKNEISDFLTALGIVLLVVGAVGIGCVVVWSFATRHNTYTPEEEVYHAVSQADVRNKADRRNTQGNYVHIEQPRAAPVHGENRAPRPAPRHHAEYDTDEIINEALRSRNKR